MLPTSKPELIAKVGGEKTISDEFINLLGPEKSILPLQELTESLSFKFTNLKFLIIRDK